MTLLAYAAGAACLVLLALFVPRAIVWYRRTAALRRSALICAAEERRGLCIAVVEMGEAYSISESQINDPEPWHYTRDSLVSLTEKLRVMRAWAARQLPTRSPS